MTLTATASPLSAAHRRTYEAIFRHPVAHNLSWRSVHALLSHLANVAEEPNGNLKIERHGHTLVLRPARTKDISEADEIMTLRHFLTQSETPPPKAQPGPWLLVIDHREARLFRSTAARTVAEKILPPPPSDFFRLPHNAKAFSRGKEKPDPSVYFGAVARALSGAPKLLVAGSGKGSSSEAAQFVAWLKRHQPALAGQLAGPMVIDEHHLTKAQILAAARKFLSGSAQPAVTR